MDRNGLAGQRGHAAASSGMPGPASQDGKWVEMINSAKQAMICR